MIRAFFFAAAASFILMVSTPASAQDKVAQGASLFASQKCILCHSLEGKGNKKGPLDGVGAKLKPEEIRQWLVNPDDMRVKTHATRSPAMKNFSTLPKDQLDALVVYLQSQKAVNADNNER
jgi:mono/diheme cytochrome c family protein